MSDAQILGVLSTLAARLEDVTGRLEKLEVSGGGASSGGGGGGGGLSASVAGWRTIMSNEVAAWVAASNAVGGKVAAATAIALTGFDAITELIEKASVCAKPSDVQVTPGTSVLSVHKYTHSIQLSPQISTLGRSQPTNTPTLAFDPRIDKSRSSLGSGREAGELVVQLACLNLLLCSPRRNHAPSL